jgi:hypothetical protein
MCPSLKSTPKMLAHLGRGFDRCGRAELARICETSTVPRHLMGAPDLALVRWAGDVDLTPDGRWVAWCETALDPDRDEPVS